MTAKLHKVWEAIFMVFMILLGIIICTAHWLYTSTMKLIAWMFRDRTKDGVL